MQITISMSIHYSGTTTELEDHLWDILEGILSVNVFRIGEDLMRVSVVINGDILDTTTLVRTIWQLDEERD